MSKTKKKKTTRSTGTERVAQDAAEKTHHQDGVRETIESIVIAFILAFLFRAYEAEAFVIPTGSMAPTLYGRHKEADCEQCGYHFTFGASGEVDDNGHLILGRRIGTAVCPNCRFEENNVRDLPVFTGDRILVTKFPFEFGDPERWGVTVFRFPEEPKTNYIKRMVGLPNETVILRRGDVYRREPDGRDQILRKDDPNQQNAIQILVYDDASPPRALLQAGWPERWSAMTQSPKRAGIDGWVDDDAGWAHNADERSFAIKGDADPKSLRWIRYRNFVPTSDNWRAFKRNQRFDGENAPGPRMIADFCGYNACDSDFDPSVASYWVGDLTASFELDIESVKNQGELLIELNEGVNRYRCRIDVGSGMATLLRNVVIGDRDEWEELASAPTPLKGDGRFAVTFANVDDRLCLWVTGSGQFFGSGLIDFGGKGAYDVPRSAVPGPTDADLIPVGIAAQGLDATVSRLQLHRDIYYEGEFVSEEDAASRARELSPFQRDERSLPPAQMEIDDHRLLYNHLGNPSAYADERHRSMRVHDPDVSGDREIKFVLGPDEYLMLGDNSPRSKDGRLWGNTRRAERRHAVPRSALVGKAFYVYWPHGVPFMKDGQGYELWNHTRNDGTKDETYPSFRAPFYPNIPRMHRVR